MRTTVDFGAERMNRDEAALYLGISPGTLAVWACTGRYNLPVVRVGSRCFYRKSDLDMWLARHTLHAASSGAS